MVDVLPRAHRGRHRSGAPQWALLVVLGLLGAGPAHARTRGICYLDVWPFFQDDLHHESCGKDRQLVCDTGAACDAGHRALYFSDVGRDDIRITCGPLPDEVFTGGCVACGGIGEIACGPPVECAGSATHVVTDALDGPIEACGELLPADPDDIHIDIDPRTFAGITYFPGASYTIPLPSTAAFLDAFGTCSDGAPEDLSGASREPWPADEPPSDGRGTVVFVHGRGASCAGKDDLLNASGGMLVQRHHRVYCVEYDQSDDEPLRRVVQVFQPTESGSGEGPGPCAQDDRCTWNLDEPVVDTIADTYSVVGIAQAVAQALLEVPPEGEITLIAHSQGGFVARELVHRHHDALRWSGRRISRVVTLGHPWLGKVVDPSKAAPWLCASEGGDVFDCRVQEWLWGWQDWIGSSTQTIDDRDFPQIAWTAVAGADQSTAEEDAASNECLEIFGGVWLPDVVGDTSVPIQSSLGIDEHGFYAVDALAFDDALQTPCTHNATCMLRESLLADPDRIPTAPPPGPPLSGALAFDGTGASALGGLDPVSLAELEVTDALTLEAWIRPEVAGQSGIIVNKEGEYELALLQGELSWALGVEAPAWAWVGTSFSPAPRRWTHVALTFDAAAEVVGVYVDGERVSEVPALGAIGDALASDALGIGGRATAHQPFHGRIGDVRIWSTARSSAELREGLAGVDPSDPALLAWWTFDEPAGDVAFDESGFGHDLSLTALGEGPRRYDEARLRPGGALYVDGPEDRVVVRDEAALAALDMDEALTLEAWLFVRGPGGRDGGVVVNKEGEYALTRLPDGTLAFSLAVSDPGWVTVPTKGTVPLRTWTHVALTYQDGSPGAVEVYVDGALVDVVAATGPISDAHPDLNELWIGGRQRLDQDQWLHGAIDEVRVWNVRRTPEQIEALAARELPAWSRDGLVGYWRLDATSGALVMDDSGAAHHGLLQQTPGGPTRARSFGPALPGYPDSLRLPPPEAPDLATPDPEEPAPEGVAPDPDAATGCGCRTGDPRIAPWLACLALLALRQRGGQSE